LSAQPIQHDTQVVIAGGGLAGIATAFELLDQGCRVLLIDKDSEERFGGLAKESFGGVHLIDTPHQRRLGLKDNPDLALRDWLNYAKFGEADALPRKWAEQYCMRSGELIFDFLDKKGVRFLPLVNWPERGLHIPGNTVPRWHIAWGTGHDIVQCCVNALEKHPRREHLSLLFEHEVNGLSIEGGRVVGVHGRSMRDEQLFEVRAEHVVIAAGGICGGDLSRVRKLWHKPWGEPPEVLLNGAHRYGDGLLHDRVAEVGGNLTHMDRHWHYAAGIHHPRKDRPADGLSLVPPRSALWVNAHGARIRNPAPLVSYTDTRHLVESVLKQPGKYSWQVMNYRIAAKELAVSGSSYMTAFRFKKKMQVAREVLFGNTKLVDRLIAECPDDIVTARELPELVEKMNERSLGGHKVSLATLQDEIAEYDGQITRGAKFFNDEQLRRIANFRTYRGDRIRTCKYQKILDSRAMPLIAIREFILARKSLGGIQTDLKSRVLRADGSVIDGLYAVGEAAGFGGGGIHGQGSLEGTFLGSCVLTGRVAARAIAEG
jgi:predicted oxidoreductase